MPRHLLLVTVGTSAFAEAKLEPLQLFHSYRQTMLYEANNAQRNLARWAAGEWSRNRLSAYIEAHARALLALDWDRELNHPPGGVTALPAEVASLHLMYRDGVPEPLDPADDVLALLLSDSVDGVLAGLLLRECLRKNPSSTPAKPAGGFSRIEVAVLEGLNTTNFHRFFKSQIRGVVDTTDRFIEKYPHHYPILTTTGGYKALIPYLTHLAHSRAIPMTFLHEDSAHVIALAPFQWAKTEEDRKILEASREGSRLTLEKFPFISNDAPG